MKLSVTVTGAAGQISYALLPRLGELLDHPDQKIDLRLLEIEAGMPRLKAVVMELEDCAFPFIDTITATSDEEEAFKGCELAILLGAQPRTKGMERSDLLTSNAKIFQKQGQCINNVASQDIKVLVVGNPCNANAYVLMKNAPDINPRQIFAMSSLDQNRAVAGLSNKAGCDSLEIQDLYVWGNHSATMYTDFYNASIYTRPALDIIKDEEWLKDIYIPAVAQRGTQVIEARGSSSALSAASAAIDSLVWLTSKSPNAGGLSLGICSQGEYGSQPGNIVSMPCVFNESGELIVIENIEHNEFAQSMLAKTFAELAEEVKIIHENGLVTS